MSFPIVKVSLSPVPLSGIPIVMMNQLRPRGPGGSHPPIMKRGVISTEGGSRPSMIKRGVISRVPYKHSIVRL